MTFTSTAQEPHAKLPTDQKVDAPVTDAKSHPNTNSAGVLISTPMCWIPEVLRSNRSVSAIPLTSYQHHLQPKSFIIVLYPAQRIWPGLQHAAVYGDKVDDTDERDKTLYLQGYQHLERCTYFMAKPDTEILQKGGTRHSGSWRGFARSGYFIPSIFNWDKVYVSNTDINDMLVNITQDDTRTIQSGLSTCRHAVERMARMKVKPIPGRGPCGAILGSNTFRGTMAMQAPIYQDVQWQKRVHRSHLSLRRMREALKQGFLESPEFEEIAA
ncbi:hypothetical protein DFP73DRAFT_527325 [Morchella snyderi]|nr:hypothetical protein DFP73DRAFT_527325 [Morchella snyderi]